MEEKLLKYRKERKRKEVFNQICSYFKNVGLKFKSSIENPSRANSINDHSVKQEKQELIEDELLRDASQQLDSAEILDGDEEDDTEPIDSESLNNHFFKQFFLFIIWIILYIFFIIIEFGAVYFVISILVFIYFNTRTGSKPANEISAYSVFNEHCRAIDGTLNAEQIDREIRGGFY